MINHYPKRLTSGDCSGNFGTALCRHAGFADLRLCCSANTVPTYDGIWVKKFAVMFPFAGSGGVITSFHHDENIHRQAVAAFLLTLHAKRSATQQPLAYPFPPKHPVKSLQIPCLLARVNWRGTAFLGHHRLDLGPIRGPVTRPGEFFVFLDLGGGRRTLCSRTA